MRLACTLLVLLAAGCAGDAMREDLESRAGRLCDGTDALRFAYRLENGYARPGTAEDLLCEPGLRYLYVDGQCRYWVADPEQVFCTGEPRTGVLDGSLEARLAATVPDADFRLLPAAAARRVSGCARAAVITAAATCSPDERRMRLLRSDWRTRRASPST